VQGLDKYYLSFGRDVVSEVERQLDEHGNLVPILKKLGVPALPGLHNQHRALQEFLYKYGVFIFFKAAQTKISPDEINVLKMQKLMGTPMLGAATHHQQASPSKKGHRDEAEQPSSHSQSSKHRSRSGPQTRDDVSAMPVKVVDAKDKPFVKNSENKNAMKRDQNVSTAEYSGSERRTGNERRATTRQRRSKSQKVWLDRRRKRTEDRRKEVRRAEDRKQISSRQKGADSHKK
jgi:hypothetical protein